MRAAARREGRDRLGCAGAGSGLLTDEVAKQVSLTGETPVVPSLMPHQQREMRLPDQRARCRAGFGLSNGLLERKFYCGGPASDAI